MKKWRKKGREIDPDEILLDSSNIPRYDREQFEGRLEKPISRGALYAVGGIFALCVAVFFVQAKANICSIKMFAV